MLPQRKRRPLPSEQRCGWWVWEGMICENPPFALALSCDTYPMATHTPSWDNPKGVSPGVMTAVESGQKKKHAWAKAAWEEVLTPMQ